MSIQERLQHSVRAVCLRFSAVPHKHVVDIATQKGRAAGSKEQLSRGYKADNNEPGPPGYKMAMTGSEQDPHGQWTSGNISSNRPMEEQQGPVF